MTQDASSTVIPPWRALTPRPAERLPAHRRVALALKSVQVPGVVRAAGALALGVAAEYAVRAVASRIERGGASTLTLPGAHGLPSPAAPPVAPPVEVDQVVESLAGATRVVVTEVTVIEVSRRPAR